VDKIKVKDGLVIHDRGIDESGSHRIFDVDSECGTSEVAVAARMASNLTALIWILSNVMGNEFPYFIMGMKHFDMGPIKGKRGWFRSRYKFGRHLDDIPKGAHV